MGTALAKCLFANILLLEPRPGTKERYSTALSVGFSFRRVILGRGAIPSRARLCVFLNLFCLSTSLNKTNKTTCRLADDDPAED